MEFSNELARAQIQAIMTVYIDSESEFLLKKYI
jgi:hypothetical protein